jgi:uncharacterized protein YgiM (DUF1202 family)
MKIITATALLLSISLPATAQVETNYSKEPETRTYGEVCTVVRNSSLSMRSGPSKNYQVVSTISPGSSLPLFESKVGRDNFKWWLTKNNGKRGWVRADYICNILVDTALEFHQSDTSARLV